MRELSTEIAEATGGNYMVIRKQKLPAYHRFRTIKKAWPFALKSERADGHDFLRMQSKRAVARS